MCDATYGTKRYKETYARLNVYFYVYLGKLQVTEEMEHGIQMLEDRQSLQESTGARVMDLKMGKLGVAVITKKDGSTLYLTCDIGAAIQWHGK